MTPVNVRVVRHVNLRIGYEWEKLKRVIIKDADETRRSAAPTSITPAAYLQDVTRYPQMWQEIGLLRR